MQLLYQYEEMRFKTLEPGIFRICCDNWEFVYTHDSVVDVMCELIIILACSLN